MKVAFTVARGKTKISNMFNISCWLGLDALVWVNCPHINRVREVGEEKSNIQANFAIFKMQVK